jgi:hypothetical protein
MSDIINQAYDEMDLSEVVCRLPSEFAIGSIKRRIDNVDKFKEFFKTRDVGGAIKCNEVKNHINKVVSLTSVDDIFDTLTPEYHPTLFGWLNATNKTRLLENGKDRLTVEFIFNLTKSDDLDGMRYILDRVLLENEPQIPKITSILNKIDTGYFQQLVDSVIKDTRPKVKSSILSVHNGSSVKTISDHQKMIALKAFAKIPTSDKGSRHIQPLDFKLFQNLKPLERIMALDRYLTYFPTHRKIKVFNPEPTQEEFDFILFAGCFQFNDVVEDIVKKYNAITKDEKPDKDGSAS